MKLNNPSRSFRISIRKSLNLQTMSENRSETKQVTRCSTFDLKRLLKNQLIEQTGSKVDQLSFFGCEKVLGVANKNSELKGVAALKKLGKIGTDYLNNFNNVKHFFKIKFMLKILKNNSEFF